MTTQTLIAQNRSNPKALAGSGWSRDDDDLLQKCWNDLGLEPLDISAQIGRGHSRSAILGRVHRLRGKGWHFEARSTRNVGPGRLRPAKPIGDRPARHKPSSPAAVAPPIFDFTAMTDPGEIERPERTKARFDIPGLPRITPERVQARRVLELHIDEQRFDGALRCICGKVGAVHCAKHKALLQREGVL